MFCRLALFALAVVLLLPSTGGASPGIAPAFSQIQERGQLVVAQYGGERRPFFMHDETGGLFGFDIDLATAIAKQLGVEVLFNRSAGNFDEVVELVMRGEADIAISKLSVTLNRAQRVRFTTPYITLHQGLLINRLKAAQLRRGTDPMAICNSSKSNIGVIGGTSYEGFAKDTFPKAQITPYNNFQDLLDAAIKGEITAILYDEMEIKKLLRAKPDIMLNLRLVILEDREDSLSIAVAADNPHLLDWLNLFLKLKGINPTIESLLDRYPDPAQSQQ